MSLLICGVLPAVVLAFPALFVHFLLGFLFHGMLWATGHSMETRTLIVGMWEKSWTRGFPISWAVTLLIYLLVRDHRRIVEQARHEKSDKG
jgi:hypothetical protein